MTPRQQALIRASFDSVRELAGPFSLLFYGRLFDTAPPLRQLFPADLKEQGAKLMAMFEAIVQGLEQPEQMRPVLRELGRNHVGYGVQPGHYDILASAFLWSLAQTLEGGYTPEMREAWAGLIHRVNDEMKAGAAEAPASAAPTQPGAAQNE